jgi:electron transfer flavoprotein alpha subunit
MQKRDINDKIQSVLKDVILPILELPDPKIVVSGGRGVGSAEGFRLVENLAETLRNKIEASKKNNEASPDTETEISLMISGDSDSIPWGPLNKSPVSVGASRAAVVSGFAPRKYLIGINGRTVTPDLYIACGISGSLQHRFGMTDSKQILAINDDHTVPIFEIATAGIIGDLHEILPILTEQLKTF